MLDRKDDPQTQDHSDKPDDRASQLSNLLGVDRDSGPKNPMFRTEIDADLTKHRVPGTSKHTKLGQPLVQINFDEIDPFSLDPVGRIKALANLHPIPSEEFTFQNFFRKESGVPQPSQILKFGKDLVSGFVVDSLTQRAQLVRATPGDMLDVVQPQFVLLLGAAWSHPEFSPFHPLKNHHEQPALPIIGDLWLDGEPLSEDVLSALGISPCGAPVTDSDGNQSVVLASCNVFRSGGRAFLLPVRTILPLVPTSEGGLKIPSLDDIQDSSRDKTLTVKPVVAFQYTGIGMGRYLYHAAPKDQAGRVLMDEAKDVIVEAENLPCKAGVAIVQRTEYAGKSGIFLDIRHQASSVSPTGGLADDTISIERDALLLRHGATMGGITINSASILQRKKLEQVLGRTLDLPWENLHVLVRAIFDSSHRLSAFSISTGKSFATQILPEILGTTTEKFSTELRDEYLTKLATTLGHNASICLGLSLTLPTDQVALDNLSVFGGILDSENFVPMRSRYEALGVIKLWVQSLVTVATACGVELDELRRGKIVESFARALLPNSFKPEKLQSFPPENSCTDGDELGSLLGTILTIAWVEQSMSRDRVGFPVAALLTYFKQNRSELQVVLGGVVPRESDLSRWIKYGLPDPVVFDTISFSGGSVVRHQMPYGAFVSSLAQMYIGSRVIAHQRRLVSAEGDPPPREIEEVPY